MRNALIILFCLCGYFSFSQENSLLYKVSGDNGKVAYIYGTMHMLPDSLFYFPQKLEKILSKSSELVLEIDNISDRERAEELLKLKEGSCFDLFTAAQKDSVITWGSTLLHMKPEAFEKGFSSKKPFTLMQLGMQDMMKGPVKFMELELMGRAANYKLPISGLETMEFQISVFDNLPDSIMNVMIMDLIRHPESNKATYAEMYAMYQQQNVEALAKLIESSDEMAGSTDVLLIQRNKNWIPGIEQKMSKNGCFVAVGAGHLGGEQGILQLLRNKGYKVTPVRY
ncbi:MAG: TraB/GumN family protein [Fluviicola sp.]